MMSSPTTTSTDCVVRPVTSRSEWSSLFLTLPAPAITQAWAYGEAKRLAGGWQVERLAFECGGVPVAICQVLVKRVLGLAVAARINRGPQFLADAPDETTVRSVYAALRRRWRFGLRGVLVLAPGLAESDAHRRWLQAAGFIPRGTAGWCSAVLDLREDAAVLRQRMAATWRTQLNGAERGGLRFEISHDEGDFAWMLDRHAENMREKGFAGTPVSFLQALHETAPADCFVCRVSHDGAPLAGMLVFRFGRSAEYFVGWFGPEARRRKAGNFLMWNAALAMQARGCVRFDLGGYSSSEGYGRFKQGLRGSEYRLLSEWLAF